MKTTETAVLTAIVEIIDDGLAVKARVPSRVRANDRAVALCKIKELALTRLHKLGEK